MNKMGRNGYWEVPAHTLNLAKLFTGPENGDRTLADLAASRRDRGAVQHWHTAPSVYSGKAY